MALPASRPMPAPAAAGLPWPPIRAPAAAPIAVPITALFTPLFSAAPSGVVPPTWLLANWRQSMSSARNWSKLLPVPGSTITPGPVGMETQAPSSSSAASARTDAHWLQLLGCGATRCQPAGHSLMYG